MAKKSKNRKYSRGRRRSVRGVNVSSMLTSLGGVLIGTAAAGYMNKLLLQNQNPMMQTVIPLAAGVVLPMVLKNDLGKYAGLGMAAYGAMQGLKKAGLGEIAGLEDQDATIVISGDELATVAGEIDEYAMAGDEFAMAGGQLATVAASYDEELED